MGTTSIIALVGMLICAVVIVCLVRFAILAAQREREENKKRKSSGMSKIARQIIVALLPLAAMCMTACSNNEDVPTSPAATAMHLSVNGEHYDIALPATGAVNLTTLCTEFDAEVTVENAEEFQNVTVGGRTVTNGSCSLPVGRIDKDTQIEIAYTTGGQEGRILLNTLHTGIPEIKATGKAEADGDFYLSFVWLRLIMKYDNEGSLLFYRYEPRVITDQNDVSGWWDFKKHQGDDGKTYYSYHANDPAHADRVMMGYDPGKRVILDEKYRVVKTIGLLTSRNGDITASEPLDGHDFYFFNPDHYIVSAYVERDKQGQYIYASYLQEVLNDEVVFDWWSTTYKYLKTWIDPFFGLERDYVHFNSVQVLPDGDMLCSLRHLSSLVKIDRSSGAGNILWRIAGTELDEAQAFSGQHNATLLDDGTITLFDNGNGHNPQVTRLLCLKVNPETGEVTGGGNILPEGDNSYFTQACGSFGKVGDYYVAGWGIPGLQDGPHDRLVNEYDASGHEIFGLRLTGTSYQQNFFNASYRCVKCQ